jgi:hypothetical protein
MSLKTVVVLKCETPLQQKSRRMIDQKKLRMSKLTSFILFSFAST